MKNLWWFCLSSLLFLASCGWRERAIPVELARADSLMDVRPDSAMAYLASLDSFVQGEPEYVRMYYALQQIKAQDKCYIPHTSDSVILSLIRYYTDYGTPDQQMEAYHYLGSVYRDMGDAPRAVEAYQKAADIGKESGSRRNDILGRTYEQVGYRLAYQGLYDEALRAYKESHHYFLNTSINKGKILSLRNIARMYNAQSNIDSAIYYYEKAYKLAASTNDLQRENDILSELSCIYIDEGKYDAAQMLYKQISDKEDPNMLYGLGCIYKDSMRLDSATYYIQKANATGNIYMRHMTYYLLAELEQQKGNYISALNHALSCIHVADTIKRITRTEAIAKVNSLYNYQHTENENNQLKIENSQKEVHNYRLTIYIILLLIGTLLYIIYSNNRRKKTIEDKEKLRKLKEEQYAQSVDCIRMNEKKIAELETLWLQAEAQKDNLKKQLIQLQKEQLELSNRKILASQNEKDLLEITLRKSHIYRLFHEADVRITENDWTELRNAIDTTYANFTARLYALYPKISKQELYICYLIKIEIPVKDIAKIIGRSTSAITASRIRLYKKIHKTDGTADMMDKLIIDL